MLGEETLRCRFEAMSRKELQKAAKDRGLKANIKNSELVEALVRDAAKPGSRDENDVGGIQLDVSKVKSPMPDQQKQKQGPAAALAAAIAKSLDRLRLRGDGAVKHPECPGPAAELAPRQQQQKQQPANQQTLTAPASGPASANAVPGHPATALSSTVHAKSLEPAHAAPQCPSLRDSKTYCQSGPQTKSAAPTQISNRSDELLHRKRSITPERNQQRGLLQPAAVGASRPLTPNKSPLRAPPRRIIDQTKPAEHAAVKSRDVSTTRERPAAQSLAARPAQQQQQQDWEEELQYERLVEAELCSKGVAGGGVPAAKAVVGMQELVAQLRQLAALPPHGPSVGHSRSTASQPHSRPTSLQASGSSKAVSQPQATSKGVFLFGPHGMAKTDLALAAAVFSLETAAAAQATAWTCYLPLAALLRRHGASTALIVRAAFRLAKRYSSRSGPVCIVLDQVEALSGTQHGEAPSRARTEMLVGIDSLGYNAPPSQRALVIAICSSPWGADDTLVAKLSSHLLVPLPPAGVRENIVFTLMAQQDAALGVSDIDTLVRRTEGYSYAEIVQLCHQAEALAELRSRKQPNASPRGIGPSDFEQAFADVGQPMLSTEEVARFSQWSAHIPEL